MVRRSAAEQDVIGHGLVQHGTARAGVGGALAVATHALVRQRPVQGAPGGQAAHGWNLGKNIRLSVTVTAKGITESGCSVRDQLDVHGGKSRQESVAVFAVRMDREQLEST